MVKMMHDLSERIVEIGREMTGCREHCDGIHCDQHEGVLPRCLFFDEREGERGCAVIGRNPGNSFNNERDFYKAKDQSYEATRLWWNDNARNKKNGYYFQIVELLKTLDITGPILWTELVKCESKAGEKHLPMSTRRRCSRKYLKRELELLPNDWPIFAIGKEAYHAACYLSLPDRTVIGLPHPTGSFGLFPKKTAKPMLDRIRQIMCDPSERIEWINGKS